MFMPNCLIALDSASWLPRYYAALKLVDFQERDYTLDAACGKGEISINLSQRGLKVKGLDIVFSRIELTRRRAREHDIEAEFIVGDMKSLPYKDDSFGQIVSLDTLEHIDDDSSVINEFARVLQPGGTLILSVPYGATNSARLFGEQRMLRRFVPRWLHKRKRLFSGKSWLEASEEDAMKEMGHLRHYSLENLQRKLQEYFDILDHKYALKKFSSIATDISYGVKWFGPLMPYLFYLAVRLDDFLYSNPDSYGYLLTVKAKRK